MSASKSKAPDKCACGGSPRLTDGREVYPHLPNLHHKRFWVCSSVGCDARVGCHAGGSKPLGPIMANAALRQARQRVHELFDPMWKSGRIDRTRAYDWLARRLNIEVRQCHVSHFDLARCQKAISILEAVAPVTDGARQ